MTVENKKNLGILFTCILLFVLCGLFAYKLIGGRESQSTYGEISTYALSEPDCVKVLDYIDARQITTVKTKELSYTIQLRCYLRLDDPVSAKESLDELERIYKGNANIERNTDIEQAKLDIKSIESSRVESEVEDFGKTKNFREGKYIGP